LIHELSHFSIFLQIAVWVIAHQAESVIVNNGHKYGKHGRSSYKVNRYDCRLTMPILLRLMPASHCGDGQANTGEASTLATQKNVCIFAMAGKKGKGKGSPSPFQVYLSGIVAGLFSGRQIQINSYFQRF
jgi:hypothetical protein